MLLDKVADEEVLNTIDQINSGPENALVLKPLMVSLKN